MAEDITVKNSRPYMVKKMLDRFLPAIIFLLGLYLYIEFLASPEFIFYPYKAFIQYSLLIYFVVELGVLFTMYESNKEFLKNHWFDILLTVPFVTALKGVLGFKLLKSFKPVKALKSSKMLRAVKMSQKSGKFVKKSRKQYRKKKSD
jgi:hypothetical protein